MNENGRNKREWIKTAAIIFLSVMLVLTFFSSTIQNWSLPEVATQYVQSGSITAKAMITGNIESVDPYEVKVTETRKVASVAVRTGDTVQKGDVLVYLEEKDSKELEEAKKALEKAQEEYDKALLSGKYLASDITEANRGATTDSFMDRINRAQNTVEAAKDAVKAAEDAIKAGEAAVKTAEKAGEGLTEPKKAELESVETKIKDYQQMIELQQNIDPDASKKLSEAESDMNAADRQQSSAKSAMDSAEADLNTARNNYNNYAGSDPAERARLENELKKAESQYHDAEVTYYYWHSIFDEAQQEYGKLKDAEDQKSNGIAQMKSEIAQLTILKYNLEKELGQREDAAKAEVDKAQAELEARQDALVARQDELKDKEEALAELVTRAGNVSGLQSYLKAIETAQKNVDELAEKAGGTTITAPIAGTISAINVTAGNETSAATPVVVMQREGQGYTLKYSATNDVAKRLSVGDVGTLVNAWRYDDVTVTLESIKADPDSRGQKKLLTFNVTGSVMAGQSLSFSIGQKSANYNFIVPNSAVREDNNGKFILIVQSKSSPLGTRYTASRVDVEVIASDETQSAVSGALQGYEFVITTSTKPVEAGNLVRLPD